jgi:hypothetical protein
MQMDKYIIGIVAVSQLFADCVELRSLEVTVRQ